MQAQASLQTRTLPTVTQQLQTWVTEHPRDAQAWQLLASAYAADGRTLGAIRAEAGVNVVRLDLSGALSRFKAAQNLARQVEQQLRDQMADRAER